MGNRSPFLACIVCCVLALCRRSVALESVKADKKANELAPPDALSQSPPDPGHFFARHHPDMGEEHGQLQPQAQEELRQRDVPSAAFTELVPSSVGACTSFVDNGESADDDVSCFPHNQNIGCRSGTIKQLKTDTVRGCLRQCRSVGACTHFTWNKKSKKCHLKKEFPNLYKFDGDMTGPRSCKSFCYTKCLTYSINPWKTIKFPNGSPQLCQAVCWGRPNNCFAWSFENGVCKLFPKGFSAHRKTGGDNVVTAPRNFCETKPDIRLVELNDGRSLGSCLISDDIGSNTKDVASSTGIPDVQECQRRCARNNSCTHYTYNRLTKNCFVKGGGISYYKHKGDMTAPKDCVPD